MFMPTEDGWLRVIGPEDGGHEYLLIGADRDKKCPHDGSIGAVRMLNSWGPNWGENGRAWISRANLEYLLKNEGDCCTATELKVV
jgi:C1A family cysteine protease